MMKDPSDDFVANPVKDDMFCWHFTIRGPPDTEFEGGLYHGIIKLPMSYPNRPPNIMFLTPNGRFDINMDICLSMTKYHKEEWQAAWTIRSMLEAIIAFFPVREDHDAIGALESSVENRKYYAKQSIKYKCDICGPIAKILKPIEKKPINETKTENKNEKNINNTNNENKNIQNTNDNSTIDKNNKNIKNVQNNVKKDIDSSSNSSLSSNQTGKFKFKRDTTNSSDNTKRIYISKMNDNKNANKEILLNPKDEKEENINNNENEEIEKNLFKKNNLFENNNFLKIQNLFNLKIDEEEDNKSADGDIGVNGVGIFSKKKLLNEKEFCEKKMEENIKYLKYFSRKNYEDIRDKKKRNLNIFMICIIIFVFFLYFLYSKYQASINSILKEIILSKK